MHSSQGSQGSCQLGEQEKCNHPQMPGASQHRSVVAETLADSAPGMAAPQKLLPAESTSKPPDHPPVEASAHAAGEGPAPAWQGVGPASSTSTGLQVCPALCRPVSAAAVAAGDDGWPARCSASDLQAPAGPCRQVSGISPAGMPTAQAAKASSGQAAASPALVQQERRRLAALQPWLADSSLRGWEGEGSQGTQLVATAAWCRPLACLTQVTNSCLQLFLGLPCHAAHGALDCRKSNSCLVTAAHWTGGLSGMLRPCKVGCGAMAGWQKLCRTACVGAVSCLPGLACSAQLPWRVAVPVQPPCAAG